MMGTTIIAQLNFTKIREILERITIPIISYNLSTNTSGAVAEMETPYFFFIKIDLIASPNLAGVTIRDNPDR